MLDKWKKQNAELNSQWAKLLFEVISRLITKVKVKNFQITNNVQSYELSETAYLYTNLWKNRGFQN